MIGKSPDINQMTLFNNCMSKGKAHKQFEFGPKVLLVLTKNSGIAVGALITFMTVTR